jgi:hypothetical protein
MQIPVVSESYQNYKKDAASNQLTAVGREAVCVGGRSKSVEGYGYQSTYTLYT